MKTDNTTKISIIFFIATLCTCAYMTFAQPVAADSTAAIPVTFSGLLFGNTPWLLYTVAIIFSLMGAAANTIIEVNKGIKENKNSPEKYSSRYFWKRNTLKVLLSVISNLFLIRFLTFVTPDSWQIKITNDWLMLISVVNGAIGFSIDRIITWAKPYIPFLNNK